LENRTLSFQKKKRLFSLMVVFGMGTIAEIQSQKIMQIIGLKSKSKIGNATRRSQKPSKAKAGKSSVFGSALSKTSVL
jgi:hypothetical protein